MNEDGNLSGELSGVKTGASAMLHAQLSSAPIPSPVAEKSELDERRIRLSVPRRYKWWGRPVKGILRLKDRVNVELDPIGTEVYRLCDGRRTLEEIIDIVKDRYKLSFFESRALILSFLQSLMKKDLMYVSPPQLPGGEEDQYADP